MSSSSSFLTSTLVLLFLSFLSIVSSNSVARPDDNNGSEWPLAVDGLFTPDQEKQLGSNEDFGIKSLDSSLFSSPELSAGPIFQISATGITGGAQVIWTTGSPLFYTVVQGLSVTFTSQLRIVDVNGDVQDSLVGDITSVTLDTDALYGSLTLTPQTGITLLSSASGNLISFRGNFINVQTQLRNIAYTAKANAPLSPPPSVTVTVVIPGQAYSYFVGLTIQILSSQTQAPTIAAYETALLSGTYVENSSKTLSGVVVTTGVPQIQSQITISSSGVSVAPISSNGLTYSANTKYQKVFTCVQLQCNLALQQIVLQFDSYAVNGGSAEWQIVINDKNTGAVGEQSKGIQAKYVVTPSSFQPIPSALESPSVSSVTSNSATFSWNALPAGFTPTALIPAPTSYQVQYTTVANALDSQWQNLPSVTTTSTSFSSLASGTVYYVRVAAVNAGGVSPYSAARQFTTAGPTAVLPGAPSNLQISTVSTNFAVLTWTAPSDVGSSAIDYYQVQLTLENGQVQISNTGTNTPTISLSGLSPDSTYSVRVFSHNNGGLSAQATVPVTFTTYPEAPVITAFVASDPSGTHNSVGPGSIATVFFNKVIKNVVLNQPTSCSTYFIFSAPVGTVTCQFTATNIVVITWVSTDGNQNAIQIGSLTVTPVSGRFVYQGKVHESASASAPSPALSGTWGNAGNTRALFLVGDSLSIQQNSNGQVSVTLDASKFLTSDNSQSYTLTVQVSLPGVSSTTSTNLLRSGNSNIQTVDSTNLKYQIQTTGLINLQSQLPLTFYPPTNFNGLATFTFTLTSGGNQLSTATATVSVSAVNSAPVINPILNIQSLDNLVYDLQFTPLIVTAGANKYALFNFEDPDLNTVANSVNVAATLVIQLSSGSTGWFTSAVGGASYSPAVGTQSSIHTVTGTFAQLNAAVFNFYIQIGINPTLTAYSLKLSLNDNGNGIPNAVGLTTVREVPMTFGCRLTGTGAGTATASIASIVESSDSSYATVTFSKPLLTAAPSVQCATLFDADTVQKLGSAPVCEYSYEPITGVTTLRITYGVGASFRASTDRLVVLSDAIRRCPTSFGTLPLAVSAGPYTVSPSSTPAVPVASISAPSTVDSCGLITLVGSAYNTGSRPATFSWVLPSGAQLQSGTTTSSRTITVRGSDFSGQSSVSFSLVVTSYTGQSNTASKSIAVSSLSLPVVSIRNPAPVTVTRSQQLFLYSDVTVSSCLQSGADKSVTYVWSASPSITLDATAGTANLFVPADKLTPGQTYTFTVKATMTSNTQLTASSTVQVVVQRSSLAVGFVGGLTRSAPISSTVVINPTGLTFDPDSKSTALTYSYTCVDSNNSPCRLPNSQTFVPSQYTGATGILTIPANTLSAGVYTFRLTVSDAPTGRSSSANAQVTMTSSNLPSVAITTVATVVNANQKITLKSVIGAYNANQVQFTYSWTVDHPELALDNNSANVENKLTGLVANRLTKTDYFTANSDYVFTLTLKSTSGETASASIKIHINAAPQGCILTATTSPANTPNGVFTLRASNCYDPDSSATGQLFYEFFYSVGNTNFAVSLNSPLASWTGQNVFPTSSGLVIGVKVEDSNRASTVKTTTLATKQDSVTYSTANSVYSGLLSDAAKIGSVQGVVGAAFSLSNLLSSNLVSDATEKQKQDLRNLALNAISSSSTSMTPTLVAQTILSLLPSGSTNIDINTAEKAVNIIASVINNAASGNQAGVFSQNVYDASTANSLLQVLNSLFAHVGANRSPSLTANQPKMHLAATTTPQQAFAILDQVLSNLLLAISTSDALSFTVDGEQQIISPPDAPAITVTVLRDLAVTVGSTYTVPIANSQDTYRINTNVATFVSAPQIPTPLLALDFSFTAVKNSPYLDYGVLIPSAAFITEPVIFKVYAVSSLTTAVSLTNGFGGDTVTITRPYKCTTGNCTPQCAQWIGNDWALLAAGLSTIGTGADAGTISCRFTAAVTFAIVDTAAISQLSGPSFTSWSSSVGTFSPSAPPSPSGQLTLNLVSSFPDLVKINIPFSTTGPNAAASLYLVTGCSDNTCSPSGARSASLICGDANSCTALAGGGGTLTIDISSYSGSAQLSIRNKIEVTGSNGRITVLYLDIVKPSSTPAPTGSPTSTVPSTQPPNLSGPYVTSWMTTVGTISPTNVQGNGRVTITLPSTYPNDIPVAAPFTTTGVNAAVSVILVVNCQDLVCSQAIAKQTIPLCTDLTSCAALSQRGGGFTIPIAGIPSLSIRSGYILTGANGLTTTIYIDMNKPSGPQPTTALPTQATPTTQIPELSGPYALTWFTSLSGAVFSPNNVQGNGRTFLTLPVVYPLNIPVTTTFSTTGVNAAQSVTVIYDCQDLPCSLESAHGSQTLCNSAATCLTYNQNGGNYFLPLGTNPNLSIRYALVMIGINGKTTTIFIDVFRTSPSSGPTLIPEPTTQVPSLSGPYFLTWTSSLTGATFNPFNVQGNGRTYFNLPAVFPDNLPVATTFSTTGVNAAKSVTVIYDCQDLLCTVAQSKGGSLVLCNSQSACQTFNAAGGHYTLPLASTPNLSIRFALVAVGINDITTTVFIDVMKPTVTSSPSPSVGPTPTTTAPIPTTQPPNSSGPYVLSLATNVYAATFNPANVPGNGRTILSIPDVFPDIFSITAPFTTGVFNGPSTSPSTAAPSTSTPSTAAATTVPPTTSASVVPTTAIQAACKASNDMTVDNVGNTGYTFSAYGTTLNPPLVLVMGRTYNFTVLHPTEHPFWINSANGIGTSNAWNTGVTNNGNVGSRFVTFIPFTSLSTATLHYNCQYHPAMTNTITFIDESACTGVKAQPHAAHLQAIITSPPIDGQYVTPVNAATYAYLAIDCQDLTCATPSSTVALCSSLDNCRAFVQGGATFQIPAGNALSFRNALVLHGANNLLTTVFIDIFKKQIVSNPSGPATTAVPTTAGPTQAPSLYPTLAPSTIRISFSLGNASSITVLPGGANAGAVYNAGTPEYNNKVRDDMCHVMNITAEFCASRIAVQGTVTVNGVTTAVVDFFASTSTNPNAGPQSAQALLDLFRAVSKDALSGTSSLAKADVPASVTVYCTTNGQFLAVSVTCPTAGPTTAPPTVSPTGTGVTQPPTGTGVPTVPTGTGATATPTGTGVTTATPSVTQPPTGTGVTTATPTGTGVTTATPTGTVVNPTGTGSVAPTGTGTGTGSTSPTPTATATATVPATASAAASTAAPSTAAPTTVAPTGTLANPASGVIRIQFNLGDVSSVDVLSSSIRALSQKMRPLVKAAVGSDAFNLKLRDDICVVVKVTSQYCESRILVRSTAAVGSNTRAIVDFLPSTNNDIANAGPKSAEDLLNLFKIASASTIANQPTLAKADQSSITTYCISNGQYLSSSQTCAATTTSAPSSSSSGVAWWIPVIIVVLVILFIGCIIGIVLYRKKKRQAEEQRKQPEPVDKVARNDDNNKAAAVAVADEKPANEEKTSDAPATGDYPGVQPGLKFMYSAPDWEPEASNDAQAAPQDVHVDLGDAEREDSGKGPKKSLGVTLPKKAGDSDDNSARFSYVPKSE